MRFRLWLLLLVAGLAAIVLLSWNPAGAASRRRPAHKPVAAKTPPPPLPPPPQGLTPEEEALSRTLAASADPLLRGPRSAVVVMDLRTGKVILDWNGTQPFVPASNMKVVTGAAALSILHPEFSYRTSLLATGSVEEGVLRGDLVFRGSGDPFLVPENLYLIAHELAVQGIREIAGDLVGDDTHYDQPGRNPTWPDRQVERAFAAPAGALSVNFNVAAIRTRATAPGRPPGVIVEPFGGFFEVENQARTSSARRGGDFLVARRQEADGSSKVVVSGAFPATSGESEILVPVEEPTAYALSGLRSLLLGEGITVRGSDRRGATPPGAREIYAFLSKPLSSIVRDMNKVSSNFIAEMLLKEIGARALGEPGTTEKGAIAVLDWMKSRGVPVEGLVIRDGSGLSPTDRLTARALASVLLLAARDFEIAPEFVVSLPVGGVDGTLADRMGPETRRRIRAKTGFISGAAALSGYAYALDGSAYAFSILVNDNHSGLWKSHRAMDDFCDALVRGTNRPSSPETR